MKYLLFIFGLISIQSFGQRVQQNVNKEEFQTIVTTAETFGYINGIRLDSIDAAYAEFSPYKTDRLVFDYGQKRKKIKELVITDKEGIPLCFLPNVNAMYFNFFHFNGWLLDKAMSRSDGSVGTFILKRK